LIEVAVKLASEFAVTIPDNDISHIKLGATYNLNLGFNDGPVKKKNFCAGMYSFLIILNNLPL